MILTIALYVGIRYTIYKEKGVWRVRVRTDG